MIRLLPPLVLLAACAELPPADGAISRAAQERPAPVLLPLDPLLAEGARPSRAAAAQDEIEARGAALSRATIPAPQNGELETRARRLRERAAELRAAEI